MFCRHQFRGVGQREDQLDAWWNHHPGTAVPPGVINDQDQQTLVCWIEPSLEQEFPDFREYRAGQERY